MTRHHEFRARWIVRPSGRGRHLPSANRLRKRPNLEVLERRSLLAAVLDFSTPTSDSAPEGITSAPNGKVWFTETNTGKIGVIDPATDAVSEFTVDSTSPLGPLYGITTGPNGNI
jgi:hypothetical protein